MRDQNKEKIAAVALGHGSTLQSDVRSWGGTDTSSIRDEVTLEIGLIGNRKLDGADVLAGCLSCKSKLQGK
jgi:hypothetical protein